MNVNNENQYRQARQKSSFQSNANLMSSKSTQLQGFNNITNNMVADD